MTDPQQKPLIPCQNCGADIFSAENTKTAIQPADADGNPRFEFGGQPAEREVPAKICPECGEVTAL